VRSCRGIIIVLFFRHLPSFLTQPDAHHVLILLVKTKLPMWTSRTNGAQKCSYTNYCDQH